MKTMLSLLTLCFMMLGIYGSEENVETELQLKLLGNEQNEEQINMVNMLEEENRKKEQEENVLNGNEPNTGNTDEKEKDMNLCDICYEEIKDPMEEQQNMIPLAIAGAENINHMEKCSQFVHVNPCLKEYYSETRKLYGTRVIKCIRCRHDLAELPLTDAERRARRRKERQEWCYFGFAIILLGSMSSFCVSMLYLPLSLIFTGWMIFGILHDNLGKSGCATAMATMIGGIINPLLCYYQTNIMKTWESMGEISYEATLTPNEMIMKYPECLMGLMFFTVFIFITRFSHKTMETYEFEIIQHAYVKNMTRFMQGANMILPLFQELDFSVPLFISSFFQNQHTKQTIWQLFFLNVIATGAFANLDLWEYKSVFIGLHILILILKKFLN